jgi:septal ring factor EnvC (AmiA/AmiB activator)
VEAAQSERRARALADACKSTMDERTALANELDQERKQRCDLEERLGQLAEGMCQLDQMLKGLGDRSTEEEDDCETAEESSSEGKMQPSQPVQQLERMLASCTLSAGIWVRRRRGSSGCSSSSIPVLSRMLNGSRASTMTPTSSESPSSESTGSSDSENSTMGECR